MKVAQVNQWKDIYRERVKNALFISLMKNLWKVSNCETAYTETLLLITSSTSDFIFLRTLDDMICTNTALCSRVWDICVRVSLLLKHMMLFPVKSCCLHVYLFANKIFRDISHEMETSPFPPFPQIHLPVYFPQNRICFLWIYYIIYLFIIEGQIWLSHPCRGRSGTLCALSSSEWWCVYLTKIHWPWS